MRVHSPYIPIQILVSPLRPTGVSTSLLLVSESAHKGGTGMSKRKGAELFCFKKIMAAVNQQDANSK